MSTALCFSGRLIHTSAIAPVRLSTTLSVIKILPLISTPWQIFEIDLARRYVKGHLRLKQRTIDFTPKAA
jgi:hypothetical protein